MSKVTEWSEEELEQLRLDLKGEVSLESLRMFTDHEFPGDDDQFEAPRHILDYELPSPVLDDGEEFAERRRKLADALEARNLDKDGGEKARFTGDVLATCVDAAGQGGADLGEFRPLHSFLRKYYGLPLLANTFEEFIGEMPAGAGLYILRASTPQEYHLASYIMEAYNINICHSF